MTCFHKNLLIRDGISQTDRLLKSLAPDYAKIDTQSVESLILFANKYAEKLKYYSVANSSNTHEGDWQSFIQNDVTTWLLFMQQLDTASVREDVLAGQIEVNEGAVPTSAEVKQLLQDVLFLVPKVDEWLNVNLNDSNFVIQDFIKSSISSDLQNQFKFVFAFDKEAKIYFSASGSNDTLSENAYVFNAVWGLGSGLPTVNLNNDTEVKNACDNVVGFFNALLKLIQKIKNEATVTIEKSLNEWPSHQPHMALFLAFLKVFRFAQDELNSNTKKHLDLFYKEVLRLKEKSAVPDKVYLIFELAKNVESHLLAAGTQFRAGKDDTNVEQLYELVDEVVLNVSKVGELKNTIVEYDGGNPAKITKVKAIDTPTVANEKELDIWPLFGVNAYEDNNQKKANERTAASGFAISSPLLFMSEGERSLVLSVWVNHKYVSDLNNANFYKFTSKITTQDGWVTPSSQTYERRGPQGSLGNYRTELIFKFTFDRNIPPIVAKNLSVHGGGTESKWPVLNIEMSELDFYYQVNFGTILSYSLYVKVNDVKSLLLQNNNGLIDASKPFQPFGSSPKIGDALLIGSDEVFRKKLTSLNVNVEWQGVPDPSFKNYYSLYRPGRQFGNHTFRARMLLLDEYNFVNLYAKIPGAVNTSKNYHIGDMYNPYGYNPLGYVKGPSGTVDSVDDGAFKIVDGQFLQRVNTGTIKSPTDIYLMLFDMNDAQKPVSYTVKPNNTFVKFSDVYGYERDTSLLPLTPYNSKTKNGFLKIELQSTFFHDIYSKKLTEHITAKDALPPAPYTPAIKSISLDYASQVELKADNNIEQLFHVKPFGSSKINIGSLLYPNYHVNDLAVAVPEGNLFIGLKDFKPGQNISLFFKFLEGTGDPDFEVPQVSWAYLVNDEWKQLPTSNVITDTTNGLIQTGVVKLNVPTDATSNNTSMTKGLVWLKVFAKITNSLQSLKAFNGVVTIQTQAALAVFKDNGNSALHYSAPLPVNTISKFVEKDFAIKTVTQNFPSFGAKPAEQDTEYYRRVSERLKHRSRASLISDYERMVLEQFPEIYKVKCCNHTELMLNADAEREVFELAPGSVQVVVIPNTSFLEGMGNPLQPKANVDRLLAIHQFLTPAISPFITLKVTNPRYDAIKISTKVKFASGFDPLFYKEQLNVDIIQFLCPWLVDDTQSPSFGGTVNASVVLNFIEELRYVDYLEDYKMFDAADKQETSKVEIYASTVMSILTSNDSHNIEIIN